MNEFERRRLEEIRAYEHKMENLRLNGLRPEDTEPVVKLLMENLEKIRAEEAQSSQETQVEVEEMEIAAQRGQPTPEPIDIPKPEIQVDSGEPSRPQSAPSFSQRPSIDSPAPSMPETLIQSDGPKPLKLPESQAADSPEPKKLDAAPPQIATTPAVADAAQSFDKAQENPPVATPVSIEQPELPKAPERYSPPETKTPEPIQPLDAVRITPEQLSVVPPEAFKPASVDMAITEIAESPEQFRAIDPPEPSDTPVAAPQPQQIPEQLPPPPRGGIKQAAAARSEPVPSAAPQPPPPSPAQMFEESLARIGLPPEAMPPDMVQQWRQMNQAMLQTDDSRSQYGSTQVSSFPGGNPRSIREGQGHLATVADQTASQLGDTMDSIARSLIKLNRRLDTVERIIEEGSV